MTLLTSVGKNIYVMLHLLMVIVIGIIRNVTLFKYYKYVIISKAGVSNVITSIVIMSKNLVSFAK